MAQTFLTLSGKIKMPTVGLGTWRCSDEKVLETALNVALEAGYRHIDTANRYGNEAVIGRVLKQWFNAGKLKREDIFITTKLPFYGVHPDRVEFFMKKSLKNLQLDYVDLYLVHLPVGFKYDMVQDKPILNEKGQFVPEGPTDHEGIWKKMEEQVDAGRTKLIGLSNYNIRKIERVLKIARIKPANLQVELHLYFQQKPLVEYCRKHDISVVAYCPLGSPGINGFFKSLNQPEIVEPNILDDDFVKKLAKKYSKTPAQIILRFLVQQDIVVIPKSVTPKRIKENVDLYDFQISNDDMEALKNIDKDEKGRMVNFSFFTSILDHPDFPMR